MLAEFIFFFLLATLGLHCLVWAFSSCGAWALECTAHSCGAQVQMLSGMWDLHSLTRDRTCVLCIGRWIFNHWTTGKSLVE